MADENVTKLVPTKSEADIAADLKRRFEEAMVPVLDLFDEAASSGLLIQYDGVGVAPPFFKHKILNLRIAKHY